MQLSGIDIDNARALGCRTGRRGSGSSTARPPASWKTRAPTAATWPCSPSASRQRRQAEAASTRSRTLVSDIYAVTTQANRRIRSWADIDRPGTVVAVAKGTLHEPVMKERLVHAELKVLDTPNAREQEVQSGRADVFMTDYPFSRRMLDNNDWARLVAPPAAYHLTPYAWAMQPGDERFAARVDDFLARIKADGRLMAHARRYGLNPIVAP
ncbi:MAG: transporter substrate-binding domain-containing protein [Comamonadaceae bacterium]|nr:transporter substrate-binding domain-containing protein [Comamonadaceae bacterium]